MKKALLIQKGFISLLSQQQTTGGATGTTGANKMKKELAIKYELEILGFRNVNVPGSQDALFLKAVLRGLVTVEEFGKEHFEGVTTLGPALKAIIYKYASQ